MKVVIITGLTGSGKSGLAINIAKDYNGEIISADSRYVYKGFDIASAKPTMEERDGVPHYLIDIVEPEVDYSVADFYDDARVKIYEILERGKTPIIAGGTGFYINALVNDNCFTETNDDNSLREKLYKDAEIDSKDRGLR